MTGQPMPADRLDDPSMTTGVNGGTHLRELAAAASRVRVAGTLADTADLARITADGRPRVLIVAADPVAGPGTGDLVAALVRALAGAESGVPVLGCPASGLPPWAGPADLLVAVSAADDPARGAGAHGADGAYGAYGAYGEAPPAAVEKPVTVLRVADEAARRGCRLAVVAPVGSPLTAVADQARELALELPHDLSAQLAFWPALVSVLRIAEAAGALVLPDDALESTAARLEQVSVAAGPGSETFLNPAKGLALDLAGAVCLVLATSEVGGAAAGLAVGRLAAAGIPAVAGRLPEAVTELLGLLDGYLAPPGGDDLFRDRVDEPAGPRLAVLLLGDSPPDETPAGAPEAAVAAVVRNLTDRAQRQGVPVLAVTSEGASRLERLASLVAPLEYAAAYLYLLRGADPAVQASGSAVLRGTR